MALPIYPTPTLSGKDAREFIERITRKEQRPEPVSVDAAQLREKIQRLRDAKK